MLTLLLLHHPPSPSSPERPPSGPYTPEQLWTAGVCTWRLSHRYMPPPLPDRHSPPDYQNQCLPPPP